MFQNVLIANRGAVAARVLRTVQAMGMRATVVYAEVDRELPYVALADHALALPGDDPRACYLNQDSLLAALERSGADALHPGYGFLAENAEFARRVQAAGVTFIGPAPARIEAMGHKTRARQWMAEHGLPMSPSSPLLGDDPTAIIAAAQALGYPVLVKPAGGGGGIGMLPAHDDASLLKAVAQARQAAARSFSCTDVYLERLLLQPRHIEFQVLADQQGQVRVLFERDCSLQRRHQKILEEAPAPALPRPALDAMADAVQAALQRGGYDNIGTVETLHAGGSFEFLEMNTRLQVEHAVTEAVTGLDLVEAQIRLAAGESLNDVLPATPRLQGHAIEARLYAEDPLRFLPSPGVLQQLRWPAGEGIRIETGYAEGNRVTPYFDPMIGKIIAHGPDRASAIARLRQALTQTVVVGVKTNLPFLVQALDDADFQAGRVHTGLTQQVVAALRAAPQPIPTITEEHTP